ncbi:ferrochelatase [Bacillaceae bacterium]
MRNETIGVLVMAYGTPANLDEVETYYTHIRRGKPPTPEQLADLKARYLAIGGLSPLLEITRRQVEGLEEKLNEYEDPGAAAKHGKGDRADSPRFKAYMGMKHARPFIADAVQAMVADGIRQAIGIVLAPHYSAMSVGSYLEEAKRAASRHGLAEIAFVKDWHLEPGYIRCLAQRVKDALQRFDEEERNAVKVLFTAHSLPEKIREMNDPYVDQLLATSRAVAGQAGIADWDFAWQSAGQTPVPWLGPDIQDVLRDLRRRGITAALVCPVGFVSDHLEILYDLDIACKNLARELGIHLERTASLNDDPQFLASLADVVRKHLKEAG